MSLRRAVGSLLARRLSPRATPRTAPARSFHSLRDLPIGDGAAGVAGAAVVAFAAGGALAVQYFKKGAGVDESAARKEEDMKARFGDWMKKHGKSYKDEEEKAMRFKRFKASVQWLESQPPSVQKMFSADLGYFADSTEQEQRVMMSNPNALLHDEEYKKIVDCVSAKGRSVMVIRDVMNGGTHAARDVKKGDTQEARDVKKGDTQVSG